MRRITTWLATALVLLGMTSALSASADPRPKFSIFPIVEGPIANPYPWAVKAELYAETADYDDGGRKIVRRSWRKSLSAQQLAALETNIFLKVPDPNGAAAACCNPHHYIRYYDRGDRLVGEIAICFCCACVRSEPYIKRARGQELEFNYDALKRLVADLGLPTDIQCYHPSP